MLLDVDRYPLAPSALQLSQVHIYVRHGERAPVGIRLAPFIPERWALCKSRPQLEFTVEQKNGIAQKGICLLGELTDKGRQSTENFGKSLRALYVNRLGFLPDTFSQPNSAYFRSTNMPRTIESLQHIIRGLYPPAKCEIAPSLLIRNGKEENLLGNTFSCKRLEILQLGFAQAAAAAYNHTLEPLDAKISKYLEGTPLRVDSKPRASGVMDTVRSAIAHDIPVPPELADKSITDVIERAIISEWFAGYKTEEVRRLGMGRLLEDMLRRMNSADSPKILVHSTHDTALAALCSTLDVFDEKWPAFTAHITFELFSQKSPENQAKSLSLFSSKPRPQQYVRMRYQNRTLPLPFCSGEGDHLEEHPEFCTLEAFERRVSELVPKDFEQECMPAGRANSTNVGSKGYKHGGIKQ